MAVQIYIFNYVIKIDTAASMTENIRPERITKGKRKSEKQRVTWLMGICKELTERGLERQSMDNKKWRLGLVI
jgi:hypothetical protein